MSRAAFIAFRRSLPRAPQLQRHTVSARGLRFAVFATPPVHGVTPLACINGGLLFSHALLWPALSPLAHARQLILYDQRGRGESQPPPDPQTARIEHDASDVAALRQALGIRRWDILGHSWGGGIAMLAAELDAGGTGRLVLCDAVGPTSAWIPGMHDAALPRLNAADRARLSQLDPGALHDPDPDVHSAYSRAIYPAWFADHELAQMFTPPRSASATGAAVAAALRREGYDWTRLLGGLRAETLVIHGVRDLLPTSVPHDLVAAIPGARLALIAGAGHMPFWEAPHDFFASVSSFLDSTR